MRHSVRTLILAILPLCTALMTAGTGAQQTVTVVTSFPKELTEAYKKAFEVNGAKLLGDARELAFTSAVDEARARDKGFLAVFRTTKKTVDVTRQLSALEERRGAEAKHNYARAAELGAQAGATAGR